MSDATERLRKELSFYLDAFEDPVEAVNILATACKERGDYDLELVLEAEDGEEKAASAAAWHGWAKKFRAIVADLKEPQAPHKLLAASPAYGGPMTRPYRWVLVEDGEDEDESKRYVVYRQYLDTIGGRDSGYYFGAGQQSYRDAKRRWLQRTEYEQEQRDERCDVIHGVGAPPLPAK